MTDDQYKDIERYLAKLLNIFLWILVGCGLTSTVLLIILFCLKNLRSN